MKVAGLSRLIRAIAITVLAVGPVPAQPRRAAPKPATEAELAAMKNPANDQILCRSARRKTSGKSKAVRVSLRGSLLKSQNQVLELSSISNKGALPGTPAATLSKS